MIATAHRGLEAAADSVRLFGYTPFILSDTITGEAKDVALVHAGLVREAMTHGQLSALLMALISGGGECTE